ncbi:ATP-binding protein [Litorisediminicola beolgyonensis]|uniref:histidine kinase n=1 Tax=Litorisediminicola beolgyonensis TaxID=1173614 RepID=A0ABW3ZFC1_9RHOB
MSFPVAIIDSGSPRSIDPRLAGRFVLLGLAGLGLAAGGASAAGLHVELWIVLTALAAGAGALVALGWSFLGSAPGAVGGVAKSSAQILQEVEALNRHAMVSMTDADARIIYANAKFIDATGYSERELIGRDMGTLYFEEDLREFRKLRGMLEVGESWQGENRLRTKDGKRLWNTLTLLPGLNADGQASGMIAVRTDTTVAKIAEQRSELFAALDKLADEVMILDLGTSTLRYLNQSAKDRMGLGAGDGTGVTLSDLSEHLDTGLLDKTLQTLLHGTEDVLPLRMRCAGRVFDLRLQRLSDEDRAPEALVVLRDVTNEVSSEEHRRAFVATVSHELRTPLTSVKGSMGLLLAGAGGELPDSARSMVEIAHRSADRLVSLVGDLLDIDKITSGQMSFAIEPVDLDALINDAIEANAAFADRFGVKLRREGSTGGQVWVDYDRTMQMLDNLLSNAAKFSPEAGEVTIGVEETEHAMRLWVRDSGPGIPTDMQTRIFERFTQAARAKDNQARSTGLGLAVVKAIAEGQRGSVTLDSVEGEGATFTITLPRTPPLNETTAPSSFRRAV